MQLAHVCHNDHACGYSDANTNMAAHQNSQDVWQHPPVCQEEVCSAAAVSSTPQGRWLLTGTPHAVPKSQVQVSSFLAPDFPALSDMHFVLFTSGTWYMLSRYMSLDAKKGSAVCPMCLAVCHGTPEHASQVKLGVWCKQFFQA